MIESVIDDRATRPAGVANVASLRAFVFALFFIFGGITSLNDILIPKLKELFQLSYAQGMLIQSAFLRLTSSFRFPPRSSLPQAAGDSAQSVDVCPSVQLTGDYGVSPMSGRFLILGSLTHVSLPALSAASLTAYRAREASLIMWTYFGLALVVVAVAALVWSRRDRLPHATVARTSLRDSLALLRQPRFGFGTLRIFLYVGAEVAIGSLLVN